MSSRTKPLSSLSIPTTFSLTAQQESALTQEAKSTPADATFIFPGKPARRFAWSDKIQHAAERDAADLVRTPFEGEPAITLDEIHGQRARIAFLRVAQARWRSVLAGQRRANAEFDGPAAEAAGHRETMLRYFTLRYRNNPEGQKWVAYVRTGSGSADLVQDIADILERCKLDEDGLGEAPRGEAAARARLAELAPVLSHLLSEKTLSAEALDARKLRDGAYTLVINSERRFRAAAEYWYGGTDRGREYQAFPSSAGPTNGTSENDEEEPTAPPPADTAAPPTAPS